VGNQHQMASNGTEVTMNQPGNQSLPIKQAQTQPLLMRSKDRKGIHMVCHTTCKAMLTYSGKTSTRDPKGELSSPQEEGNPCCHHGDTQHH
jgi:hypothetical protein